jgi:hypothetical protein
MSSGCQPFELQQIWHLSRHGSSIEDTLYQLHYRVFEVLFVSAANLLNILTWVLSVCVGRN